MNLSTTKRCPTKILYDVIKFYLIKSFVVQTQVAILRSGHVAHYFCSPQVCTNDLIHADMHRDNEQHGALFSLNLSNVSSPNYCFNLCFFITCFQCINMTSPLRLATHQATILTIGFAIL
jgi:hypothetical protein